MLLDIEKKTDNFAMFLTFLIHKPASGPDCQAGFEKYFSTSDFILVIVTNSYMVSGVDIHNYEMSLFKGSVFSLFVLSIKGKLSTCRVYFVDVLS